jgi:competence protein ComFB
MKKLKNYTEYIVKNALDKVIKISECCDCDECKMDISAIVLNDLKPKYTVSDEGEFYLKLASYQSQGDIDVTSAIMQAIFKVQKNPRHDKNKKSQ